MVRLDLNRGDKLEVGAARLTVAALITQEPDFSIGFINLRPRLLINAVDLPVTGLVQEGSRISYRLLVAGGSGKVENFRDMGSIPSDAWRENRGHSRCPS